MRVWLDAKTRLPLKVRVEFDTGDEKAGKAYFVFDQFTWPDGLDDKLFSLDPPAGFKLLDERK